jgi:hypothetical protein
MPKWVARNIFTDLFALACLDLMGRRELPPCRLLPLTPEFLHFALQSNGPSAALHVQKTGRLLGFGLLNDLFEQIDVGGKCLPALGSESVGGQLSTTLKLFGNRYIASFMEGSDMGGNIPISHSQSVPHFGKGQLGRGCQQGHNGQAPFLVDNPVKLEKRFRIHAFGFCSVK